MARKNLLEGLADLPDTPSPSTAYPMRGAGKTLVRSLDELARQADKYLEGEVIVDLDPDQVDISFVQDRLAEDNEDFRDLVDAIRTRGQDTPILVRPQTDKPGRFQVVFGHRRLKAARELGRKVRAVIKPLDDRTHVIAQGQENSARANLSFIERALFARRLQDLGYDREVMSAALAANAAALSKMVSVTDRIPTDIIRAIGDAPGIGRERWVELSLLIVRGDRQQKIKEIIEDDSFAALSSDARFLALLTGLTLKVRPARKKDDASTKSTWQPQDKAVVAQISSGRTSFSLALKARNATGFGAFLSRQLDVLYAQYLTETDNGD